MAGLTEALVVPDEVRLAAARALAERQRRRRGGTLRTVTAAAQLATGQVPLAMVQTIWTWHSSHPDQVTDEGCTLAAGLMGGRPGRDWALAVAAAAVDAEANDRAFRRFSVAVNVAERKAGHALWALAEQAATEAIRRAGIKLKVKMMSRGNGDRSARLAAAERIAAMPGGWGAPVLAAAGVTEAELLDRALDSFEEQAARILAESEREKLEALAILAEDEELPDREMDTAKANSDRAAHWLKLAILALLLAKITGDTREDMRGEGSPLMVAFGTIARALTLGSGAGQMLPVDTPDGVAEVLVDDLPLLEVLMREIGIKYRVTYTWRHAFYGRPSRFFPPHANLDGTTVTSRTDPVLVVAPEDVWLNRTHYAPGDHRGCTCGWELAFDPA